MEFVLTIICEYISQCYITLLLLSALTVILIANRKTKIDGTQYVWAIMGLTFVVTSCEYLEYWCNTYDKPVWILYVKTALVYLIYPLVGLLELYLVVQIKHKVWIVIPYAMYSVLVLINMFGVPIIYMFYPSHSFAGGYLRILPAVMEFFYLILLMFYSPQFFKSGNYSKSLIVIFMVLATIITTLFEIGQIAVDHTDEIIAIDILVYYFYLAAIQTTNVQAELFERKLELEKAKTELAENRLALEESKTQTLMAQIQPHFINNSLMAIRARCFDYPEIYESITNFSRYLRSNFEAIGNTKLILFEHEMDNIEAYLSLERANFGDRLNIEYDIDFDDFLVPALSVQPLVENAVRHGVGTYDEGGTVTISVHRDGCSIIVEVCDNGIGRKDITEQQDKRRGIGIDNVRKRLSHMMDGRLDIISGENGTTARITITEPQVKKESEEK